MPEPRMQFIKLRHRALSADVRKQRTLASYIKDLDWKAREHAQQALASVRNRDFAAAKDVFTRMTKMKGAGLEDTREIAAEAIQVCDTEMTDLTAYIWVALKEDNPLGILYVVEGDPPSGNNRDEEDFEIDEEGEFTTCTVFWRNGLYRRFAQPANEVVHAFMYQPVDLDPME